MKTSYLTYNILNILCSYVEEAINSGGELLTAPLETLILSLAVLVELHPLLVKLKNLLIDVPVLNGGEPSIHPWLLDSSNNTRGFSVQEAFSAHIDAWIFLSRWQATISEVEGLFLLFKDASCVLWYKYFNTSLPVGSWLSGTLSQKLPTRNFCVVDLLVLHFSET